MYKANAQEYIILLMNEEGIHQVSVDDEDIAHLINSGAEFEVERNLPPREYLENSKKEGRQ